MGHRSRRPQAEHHLDFFLRSLRRSMTMLFNLAKAGHSRIVRRSLADRVMGRACEAVEWLVLRSLVRDSSTALRDLRPSADRRFPCSFSPAIRRMPPRGLRGYVFHPFRYYTRSGD